MGAGGDREISIRITVDADGAVSKIEQLGEKVDQLPAKTKNAEQGFSSLQATLVTVSAVIAGASQVLNLVGRGLDFVIEQADKADRISDVTKRFQELTNQAGILGDKILKDLTIATENAVTQLDLMAIANRALIAGLPGDALAAVATTAKNYADSVGIDASEATRTLLDAVVKGKEATLEYFGVLRDGNIVLDKATTSTSNLGSELPSVKDSFDRIKTGIKNATNGLLDFVLNADSVKKFLADFVTGLKIIFDELKEGITDSLNEIQQGFENFKDGLSILGNVFKQVSKGELPSLEKAIDSVVKTKLDKSILDPKTTIKAIDPIKKTGEVVLKLSDFQSKLNKESKTLNETLEDLSGTYEGLVSKIENIQKLKEADLISSEQAAKGIQGLEESLIKSGASAESAQNAINDALDKIQEKADQTKPEVGLKLELTDSQRQAVAIGQTILGVLNQAASIAQDGINRSDIPAFGALLGTVFGAFLGSAFGPEGIAVGAALGGSAGGFLGQLTESLIGGDSGGTTARKKIDEFFSDLFDSGRLRIIINNQLREIRDLSFGGGDFGNPEAGFFDAFNRLPETVQQSFRGVGIAITQLFGEFDNIGGNLAAVFANNIGGSLNNLQLLIKATGKSFEELRDQIVEAFLDGNVTALEAQSALIGLQQVMQDGIPGAVGATTEALQNLFSAGARGGLAAVDAIQDIAFEAQEAGLSTLEATRQQLLASGQFTAEQVNAVFESFATFGIQNLEQLATASNETILAILANLQSQGLLEDTTQSIEETAAAIEAIPANQEKRVTFIADVRYTDSASTTTGQAVISSAGGPARTGQSIQ